MQLRTVLLALVVCASAAAEFEDHFKDCHFNESGFDVCVRKGLNMIQSYFKTGLPKYNVLPFDPFFAKEIRVCRGLPHFGFTITLRNVTEVGWNISKVTKFVSDLKNYKVAYTQSFPEKHVFGDYEFKAVALGSNFQTKGKLSIIMYNLIQTTTVTKLPGRKVRAQMDVESISNMELHLTNLIFGKQFLENLLDRIINGAWQPGFVIIKPLINELVSTAFTEIFDAAFHDFPFEQIFKPELYNSRIEKYTRETK